MMHMERVSLSLPKRVLQVIDEDLTEVMGDQRSQVIRTILIVYLSENGYLKGNIEVSEDD